jgi:hypothetical protein
MAICHAIVAENAPDEKGRIDNLIIAMSWDHRPDEVTDLSRPLAEELDARGDELRAAGDLYGAYDLYRTALKLDPRLSWTRRKAEEVRDERLGIEGKVRDSASSSRKPKEEDKEDEVEEKPDEPPKGEPPKGVENIKRPPPPVRPFKPLKKPPVP